MAIQVSPAARARMREFLDRDGAAIGVRFGVKKTGCSGYGYVVDLAREIAAADTVVDSDGLQLVIDANSLPLLDGTTIDFQRSGLNAQFVFENPNMTGECGCGESFTVNGAG